MLDFEEMSTHGWLHQLKEGLFNVWLITEHDNFTFVLPNAVFGIASALGGPGLIAGSQPSISKILWRIPHVILFNWTNLFVFDLANQRLPSSVKEDRLNKPWRPIPQGRLTPTDYRRMLQWGGPLILAINHFFLHTGVETALQMAGCWLYNDLGAGDDGWLLRNACIATAFGLYNRGSLKLASAGAALTPEASRWTLTISAIILTTMHVQDLKDQVGDAARGRQTVPLVMGDRPARWSIAVAVPFWTVYCAVLWRRAVSLPVMASMVLGCVVSARCLWLRDIESDRWTWRLWCLWSLVLYIVPWL